MASTTRRHSPVPDVGLAIGGADIAAEAGDVVFMGEPLRDLPMLVRLARATVAVIRQNIFVFAFGVNAVGIVVTAWLWPLLAPAGWWYEQAPVAAVIYHQLGSLAVLLNSMRLLWFERQSTVPALAGVKGWLRQTDVWLETHLDADGFFHWLGHHRRGALGWTAACMLGVYAVSGLTVVAPDEMAVVRRFRQCRRRRRPRLALALALAHRSDQPRLPTGPHGAHRLS